ncbi:bifunctional metallophosphatase/5'-nucleotidase [Paenibacillus psychroresistens]|uniref:Bifunctional metallophosphatase/5'-nucleotidase n=1 Tax=Paenibacillus psychroresistens TaxID=1778678 RepID=A0A6B8RRC8_9BACL|nr:bifunctional UDP-sugar hydrolase/5'-nucleotidase [Paenibacillus psychroresistens]QGQ97828.1 bifunctional metallophosphatase/5'-nucleotidase [Paenibacillus psychroresistens]
MAEALRKLVIAHTNDIHSHFEQMPQIATVIQEIKNRHGLEHLITVDCGDHMDRMRMETEGTNGQANIGIMNATGYDLVTLGNNEGLTLSMDDLAEAYGKHAEFLVLCSNLFEDTTKKHPSWLKPYHIMEKDGLQIGFIAVTAPYDEFYILLGWDVRDPFETTSYWVNHLREQVDVLIVLSHLGLTNDQRMAKEIAGIDLILGGHTHHLLEVPLLVEQTYLCATGKFGQYVGEVELTYDPENKRIHEVKGRCIPVKDYEPSSFITQKNQFYQEKSAIELNQVVVKLEQPVVINWYEESDFGNLLAAGIRKWVKADIGIVNAGQILQSLMPGEVTKEQLLHLCPSPINPCLMRLEGKHIIKALEESLQIAFQEKAILGYGFRGKLLGTLCTDGLEVEYDPEGADYKRITNIWVKGDLLQSEQTYLVGTIDMFTFGIGYMSLKEGKQIEFSLPEFLRNLLVFELGDPTSLLKSRDRHWHKL